MMPGLADMLLFLTQHAFSSHMPRWRWACPLFSVLLTGRAVTMGRDCICALGSVLIAKRICRLYFTSSLLDYS